MRTTTAHPITLVVCAIVSFYINFGSVTGVRAYVPPVSELLHMMSEALGQTAAATVEQQVAVFRAEAPTRSESLTETLRYAFPGRFRSEIETDSGQWLRIVSGEQGVAVFNGRVTTGSQSRCESYKDLMLFHGSPLLDQRLATLGLNFALSSLGRMDERLVYVLGARYPDPGGCQIWLDKETLRPIRWFIPADGGQRSSNGLDIQYADWQPVGSIWYPWRVSCYQDGSLVRRIEVQEVKITQGFPDELFHTDRFEYLEPKSVIADSGPQSPIREVEQAIENFHRLYQP